MDGLQLRVARMLAKVIRWAVVNDSGADTDPYQTQGVTYLGKNSRSQVWYPYGFNAHAPNGSMALMWAVAGDAGSQVHMPGSPQERVKVAPGEVVMYHPASGAKVHMKEDGSIAIDAPLSVDITAGTKVNVTAGTGATISSPSNVITGGPTTVNNLFVLGALDVAGDATFDQAINATSAADPNYDLATHIHRVPFSTGPGDTEEGKD